jgi:mannose-6-phosphate isomerase-like protein (cupin superfamily)
MQPDHFEQREQAVAEIEAHGLYCAEADLSADDLSPTAHTHPYDVHIYVTKGEMELHEPDTGLIHRLEPGSMTVVPAGTAHSEHSVSGLHAVFGVSVDPAPLMAARTKP